MAASCRLHWPNNVFGTLLLLLLEVVGVASAAAAAAVALKMPTRCNAAIKALLTIVGTLYPSLPRMLPKMRRKRRRKNRNCHCTTIGIIIGCNDFGFLAKSAASPSLSWPRHVLCEMTFGFMMRHAFATRLCRTSAGPCLGMQLLLLLLLPRLLHLHLCSLHIAYR